MSHKPGGRLPLVGWLVGVELDFCCTWQNPVLCVCVKLLHQHWSSSQWFAMRKTPPVRKHCAPFSSSATLYSVWVLAHCNNFTRCLRSHGISAWGNGQNQRNVPSAKSTLVLSFCYRLTRVVPDKGALTLRQPCCFFAKFHWNQFFCQHEQISHTHIGMSYISQSSNNCWVVFLLKLQLFLPLKSVWNVQNDTIRYEMLF